MPVPEVGSPMRPEKTHLAAPNELAMRVDEPVDCPCFTPAAAPRAHMEASQDDRHR